MASMILGRPLVGAYDELFVESLQFGENAALFHLLQGISHSF